MSKRRQEQDQPAWLVPELSFNTPYETGCTVADPVNWDTYACTFDGFDSDGVLCSFRSDMVTT